MWWRNHDNIFSRFDRVPACDGRTDGQTDVKPIAITCFSIADARKNQWNCHDSSEIIIRRGLLYCGVEQYAAERAAKHSSVGVFKSPASDCLQIRLSFHSSLDQVSSLLSFVLPLTQCFGSSWLLSSYNDSEYKLQSDGCYYLSLVAPSGERLRGEGSVVCLQCKNCAIHIRGELLTVGAIQTSVAYLYLYVLYRVVIYSTLKTLNLMIYY